ncbi:hypothetical protein DSL72_000149 [Monilinia vaccinii-corymbosi]|uniref:DNA-directed RNA polymerase I subunit RPA49 n=1 Tax=Monilinia vaccinii-corymbosi TaxID=61207 RepID=A0A8A3P0W6_9HELO|nr:hypothetical protein DSL72_000149 [Monilinia vaccinii-corymbosi]
MVDNIEKSKKRKKNADGSSRPSKKVAIEDGSNVKISLKVGDEWAPVIASTPGLAMPASISLQPFSKQRKNPPQRPGYSGAIATTEVLLHSSDHPKLDYTAREEEAGGSDTLLKHYVGVYDPKTGKLEVMEARKMVVRGSARAHQDTEAEFEKHTFRELRNDLGETFGTKKSKKAIASITENAISANRRSRLVADGAKPAKLDAAKSAVIASMAEATSAMASRKDLEEQADAAKPRPKADLSAKDIKDVYTVDSLIGSDIFKSVPVLEWEQAVKEKKNITTNSRYVSARIVTAATAGVDKLRILRYLLLLLDLHMASRPMHGGKMLPKMLPKHDEMKSKLGDNLPQSLLEDIRRKYSDAGVMSKFKSDLLITHVCALACLVDNYEVDLYDLQLDLKLETNEMSQYFKEIGARIAALPELRRKALNLDKATAAQRKTAKLKLPLDFPRVPFGKRR